MSVEANTKHAQCHRTYQCHHLSNPSTQLYEVAWHRSALLDLRGKWTRHVITRCFYAHKRLTANKLKPFTVDRTASGDR